jgi:hypothetical protein
MATKPNKPTKPNTQLVQEDEHTVVLTEAPVKRFTMDDELPRIFDVVNKKGELFTVNKATFLKNQHELTIA